MPITKSAQKALRKDKRKTMVNLPIKTSYREAVKTMRQKPTLENLTKASIILDRAAKKKVIHKNKAARLKSKLVKLLSKKGKKK